MSVDLYSEELEARLAAPSSVPQAKPKVLTWWLQVQDDRIPVNLVNLRVNTRGQTEEVTVSVDIQNIQQYLTQFEVTGVGWTVDSTESLLHRLPVDHKQYACVVEIHPPMTLVTVYLNGR